MKKIPVYVGSYHDLYAGRIPAQEKTAFGSLVEYVEFAAVEKYLPPDKWPGKYPTESGTYQFNWHCSKRTCVEVIFRPDGRREFLAPGKSYPRDIETHSCPAQWGPRVYLFGEE